VATSNDPIVEVVDVVTSFADETYGMGEVRRLIDRLPSRSVIPARRMYTEPSHSGAKIAAPVCIEAERWKRE
jgi:hypothetical protein